MVKKFFYIFVAEAPESKLDRLSFLRLCSYRVMSVLKVFASDKRPNLFVASVSDENKEMTLTQRCPISSKLE
jgi:hypothetical protein